MKSAEDASVTEDEVRSLIATGTKEGVFLSREKEMIDGVLRLADRSIESVMVQRGDIIWLDAKAPLEDTWAEARASGHARFLMCEGELEQLIGVITLADLSEAVRAGRLDSAQQVRPPLYIPPTVSLLRLLELFRESSTHLAVVTDEYGGILGLATPMDILKAIAGELPDVGSREHAEAVQRDDGSWLIDGTAQHPRSRTDLLARNDLSQDEDYHTLAGFVLWRLGRLPVCGESLTWRDLRIEVIDMDGPRIDKLLGQPRAPGQPAP